MKRAKQQFCLDYHLLEERRLLAAGTDSVGAALVWTDVAGNMIENADIPNRTDIYARLTTSEKLPDTVVPMKLLHEA